MDYSTQEHVSLPKILTRNLSELRIFSVIRNPDLLSFFCVLSYIVRLKNRPEKYVKSLLFKKAIYVLSNLFERYTPLSQAVIYLRLTKNNNTKPICYSLKSHFFFNSPFNSSFSFSNCSNLSSTSDISNSLFSILSS